MKNEKDPADPTTGQNRKDCRNASSKTPDALNNYGGRQSIFTSDEHSKYVSWLSNLQQVGPFRFTGNGAEFERMRDMLKLEEHPEFNEYVKKSVGKSLLKANNSMPEAARAFMQDWLERKKMITGMPLRYVMKETIHMNLYMDMDIDIYMGVHPEKHDPILLTFGKHLLDVGMAPSLQQPFLIQNPSRTVSIGNIAPRNQEEQEVCLNKDPNILQLCGKYETDFAFGISSLRCLLLWHGLKLTENCNIPVSVETSFFNGESKKLIVFSKPLPPKMMSKRQMMNCWAKHGLLELLKGPTKAQDNSSVQGDDPDKAGSSGLQEKSLMEVGPGPSAKRMKMDANGKGSALENSNDYDMPKQPNSMRQYLLFNLKEFKILVRSKVDGKWGWNGRRASVSSQVEYQSMFGAEKQTSTEEIYELLTRFLKNSDVHLRGHVKHDEGNDLVGLNVMAKDLFSPFCISEIEPCQIISTGMRRLHSVLSEMKKLTDGNYMLRFNASKPEHFEILQEEQLDSDSENDDDDEVELDLKRVYETCSYARIPNVSTLEECLREIDPKEVLQWHRMKKRIPASFPPRKATEEAKLDVEKSEQRPVLEQEPKNVEN